MLQARLAGAPLHAVSMDRNRWHSGCGRTAAPAAALRCPWLPGSGTPCPAPALPAWFWCSLPGSGTLCLVLVLPSPLLLSLPSSGTPCPAAALPAPFWCSLPSYGSPCLAPALPAHLQSSQLRLQCSLPFSSSPCPSPALPARLLHSLPGSRARRAACLAGTACAHTVELICEALSSGCLCSAPSTRVFWGRLTGSSVCQLARDKCAATVLLRRAGAQCQVCSVIYISRYIFN